MTGPGGALLPPTEDPYAALGAAHATAVAALAEADLPTAFAALDRADTLLASLDEQDPIDVVNVALARVRTLRRAGRFAEATEVAEFTFRVAGTLDDEDPGPRLRVHAALELADSLRCEARYEEAGTLLTDAVTRAQRDLGPDDDDTGSAWNSLGVWHRYRGERDASLAAYQHALDITARTRGADSPDYASVLHNLASVHQTTGTPAQGEHAARQAVAIREAAMGPHHPDLAGDLGVLGVVLVDLQQYDEAAQCYARARAILTRAFGPDATDLAYLAGNEAALAHLRGDLAAADTAYTEAERVCRVAFGDGHPQVAAVLVNRATLAADRGDPVAAGQFATACEELLGALVPAEHPHRVAARALLADLASPGDPAAPGRAEDAGAGVA